MNGPNGYDCMIAVSGGKDNHFQTHLMKEVMGINPLLVAVEDDFPMTEAEKHNNRDIFMKNIFGEWVLRYPIWADKS